MTDEKIEKSRELNEMAKARNQTLAQMAIAWVLRKPVITSALVGASRPQQVLDDIQALQNLDFSEEELQAIENIL